MCNLLRDKFLFIFTTRWRVNITDLETLAIGFVVLLNTIGNKSFKGKDLNRKNWNKISQGADNVGVNAMSLSDITGIPRPTVVRKLKFLINLFIKYAHFFLSKKMSHREINRI